MLYHVVIIIFPLMFHFGSFTFKEPGELPGRLCVPKWFSISRLNVTDNYQRVMIHRISRANQLQWRNLIGQRGGQITYRPIRLFH